MKCPKCGNEYDDSFKFCPECAEANPGLEQPHKEPAEIAPKSLSEQSFVGAQIAPPLETLQKYLPAMHMPPTGKPEFWRRKSTWIILAAVIVVLAVALPATLVLSSESGKHTSVAGTPKDVATAFMREGINGNYDKAFEMVAQSNYSLLGVMMCQFQDQAAPLIILKTDRASLQSYYGGGKGLLGGIFTSEGVKSVTATGEVESTTDNQLTNNVDFVSIQYKGGEKPFLIMLNQEDGEWFVDLPNLLVMAEPDTAKYISGTVGALLANPTESNCTKAIDFLQASKGLADKYGLWLQPAAKSSLTPDRAKELEDAKAIASNLVSLSAKAQAALTAAKAAPKPPAPVTPIPAWQTVIDVTGSTDKQTQTFYLGLGQKKLLYNVVGDSMPVCYVYLVPAGHSLSQEGGFPIVSPDGPGPGETYINEPAGSYYLDISSANCTWQATIAEMK